MQNTVAVGFLYVFMATLFISTSASLLMDAWKNHYAHRPMKPLVFWVGMLTSAQALHFLGLAVARFYRDSVGVPWPVLDSIIWSLILSLMAVAIVGFYASLRSARKRTE